MPRPVHKDATALWPKAGVHAPWGRGHAGAHKVALGGAEANVGLKPDLQPDLRSGLPVVLRTRLESARQADAH